MVTLIHKKDWDKFSGAVSTVYEFVDEFHRFEPSIFQDAFPDEDVVWGRL